MGVHTPQCHPHRERRAEEIRPQFLGPHKAQTRSLPIYLEEWGDLGPCNDQQPQGLGTFFSKQAWR